jgi:hypothetical protein
MALARSFFSAEIKEGEPLFCFLAGNELILENPIWV